MIYMDRGFTWGSYYHSHPDFSPTLTFQWYLIVKFVWYYMWYENLSLKAISFFKIILHNWAQANEICIIFGINAGVFISIISPQGSWKCCYDNPKCLFWEIFETVGQTNYLLQSCLIPLTWKFFGHVIFFTTFTVWPWGQIMWVFCVTPFIKDQQLWCAWKLTKKCAH